MGSGQADGTLERAPRIEGRTPMTLTLRAVSLNDQPLTQPITAHFDAKGGTIGRHDDRTMALPDPERHISRLQAEIVVADGRYCIKNVGGANPVLVRGQPLAQGDSTPLSHRDQVRIGGYLLEVTEEEDGDKHASSITQGRAAVDARASSAAPRTGGIGQPPSGRFGTPASGGLGDLLGAPLSSSNPFADLMGDATPAPLVKPVAGAAPAARPQADPFAALPPTPAGVSASSAAWGAAGPSAPVPRLPDDFDPFAAPAPVQKPAPAPGRAGAFDDLIPNAAPASIDELFGLPRGQSDPLADFTADAVPRRAEGAGSAPGGGAPMSVDPLALFGGASSTPTHDKRSTPADHTPELRGAFRPPGIVHASAPPAAPIAPAPVIAAPVIAAPPIERPAPPVAVPVASSADAWSGETRELWAAFSEAAGLRLDPPQGLNPELMRVIGTLLRTAIEGTLQLMTVRAATRHELRAQVTMIQARNNNPLKFSPDAQSALEQMLQPPMRGFLTGPAAMTESMNDLLGHSIGTMAGTRAALEGVLDRFTPKELEVKLASKSVLDSVLPVTRKAKLWDLYLQHFESIRNEAQEDFQTLFGKAFLAAYEQQLERLRRDKKPT